MACHECDLLHRLHPLKYGERAKCSRCGALLYTKKRDSFEHAIIFSVTSLLLFILANVFPFMTFQLHGRVQTSHLSTGVIEFFERGMWELGLLVLAASILFPGLKILGMLYVLVPLEMNRRPWKAAPIFRAVGQCQTWAMMDVYLLGVIVAVIKLADLATLVPGIAIFAFGALILTLAAADSALDSHAVWEKWRISGERFLYHGRSSVAHQLPCLPSTQSNPAGGIDGEAICPRCEAHIHLRKPNSLSRTWALLIAAYILYIPANLLPVMTVISFGKGEADTILSGVKELIHAGMLPIALLVFFASITVPVLKILVLTYLLISVHYKSRWRPRERTFLYRITEVVGRWSMIDIFMLSILIALVKLQAVATIEPGMGAISFASVVLLTMFAAIGFDPRLIWDKMEEQ